MKVTHENLWTRRRFIGDEVNIAGAVAGAGAGAGSDPGTRSFFSRQNYYSLGWC